MFSPRKGFSHVYPGQKNRCWCLSRQKYCSNDFEHFREGKNVSRQFCNRKEFILKKKKNILERRKHKEREIRILNKKKSERDNSQSDQKFSLRWTPFKKKSGIMGVIYAQVHHDCRLHQHHHRHHQHQHDRHHHHHHHHHHH